MTCAVDAAARRGIKVEPSRDAEYPWCAVVPCARSGGRAVHVLDKTPELAAAEALAYIHAKGWTPGPAAIARAALARVGATS
jgi:hypothetical protein